MTSPNKKRQTTESRNDAGEALASLRVAELEKIADGCGTATEPRDDDSVRGAALEELGAALRRYYEQSRAKLLSPSQKGTPIRRRSRSNSGEAAPVARRECGDSLRARLFVPSGVCETGSKRCWSLERRARHPGTVPALDEVQGVDGRRVLECSQLREIKFHGAFACSMAWRWRLTEHTV